MFEVRYQPGISGLLGGHWGVEMHQPYLPLLKFNSHLDNNASRGMMKPNNNEDLLFFE